MTVPRTHRVRLSFSHCMNNIRISAGCACVATICLTNGRGSNERISAVELRDRSEFQIGTTRIMLILTDGNE